MASQDTLQGSGPGPSIDVKSRSVSPSPHHQHPYHDPSLSLDPAFANPSYNPNSTGPESFGYPTGYLPDQQNTLSPPETFPQFDNGLVGQIDQCGVPLQQEENFSNLLNSNPSDFDFSLYQNQSPNSSTAPEYDSSLLLDPQVHSQSRSVNPADLVPRIPSPHPSASSQVSPQEQQHSSPGPMSPPAAQPYYTPQHSRHTSLDPSTANYLTSHSSSDWQGIVGNPSFQGHRRAPSEVSDVSSAAHSPYMSQHESFDAVDNNPSPLLAPQNDPGLYDNSLGIESFTLSEQPHQPQTFSPAHSPYISPQLAPQQGPEMIPSIPYISAPGAQYPTPPDMYNGDMINQGNVPDIGQASSMAPPSINVEFAPPAKNTGFGPPKPVGNIQDTLSPPVMRSRMRSKSDPFAHPASRSRSPATSSASLEPFPSASPRSLSPFDVGRQPHSNPSSREASPSRAGRRLSTSSIDTRNYILDLADPQRPGANPNDQKRVQKHPATFQCHLCPKRFTRAYNLRSHLRTHTDERPFVCTVCGKAFARQHDRKRHEGLHSGEKKFVCRGDLSRGANWGCGRRFARADALGRHFRSEAGRICIKPLLDEESQERDRVMMNHQQQPHQAHLQPIPQPLMVPSMDGQHAGNFVLPAALLAQYPALQNLQWDQIPATADDPSDIGGRSSFDASSGGEFGYDDDESGVSSVSGMSSGYGSNQGNMYQGQMLGVTTDSGYPDREWRG